MGNEIYLLTLVLGLAVALALIISRYKQPILVAYILAGAILSALNIVKPEQLDFLAILPEVGLAFLLFLVGMELDLREFRKLGKNVLLATTGQVVISTLALWFLTHNPVISFVAGFSSTILVIKILLEERELSSLHGKLAVGILLVEDLLAVILLMGISVAAGNNASAAVLVGVVIKGLLLIYASLIAGKKLLPKLFNACADSGELLFLTAIGWCLLFVSVSIFAGFSLAIGAFLAGVSLAQSVYRIQISGKIKPLRDFFIMIFFLDLGTGLSLSGVGAHFGLAVTLLVFTVFVKPLVFIVLFSLLRFRMHTAFKTGIVMSSISEFSLIVLSAASKSGIVSAEVMSPVIFATVLSFIFSSFEISHGKKIYAVIGRFIKRLERPAALNQSIGRDRQFHDHAVLIGCHRAGGIVLKNLKSIYGEDIVVLDFNPDVIEELKNNAIACVYGDTADPEVLESLNLPGSQLVISTVRDYKDNLALLDFIEKTQTKAVIILTADDVAEAVKLYERGAHYISLPTDLEGLSISRMIHDHVNDWKWFTAEREKKLSEVKNRLVKTF
ncbi:hypothetical protein A2872_00365 [Candidatus Gottesmanbacteria bacterium RIFCSPHIGHO2_01_FULL_42_12]|uniref:Uncharacterized protein n=1 Tax=Candidatus Gottesmanbacteria bacterium RIFCSPHIGHO2_01_FULL_42_12 TaxID=1798377 RepID=A0A1F5Z2Y4_9BACT|nr:MAG: hypothetical protein A2872_00365 [Candidatus Gottesmanbacteria bacterium RIFCSPHIGHO2_01_FULL_42_12]